MIDYELLLWWSLGMGTAMLLALILGILFDLHDRRRRAALPPPDAIRDLAAELARVSRRINAYAAGREEERKHAGAA